MAQKFIKLNTTGNLEEQQALEISTGAADAGKIPALDATGKLDQSMMPTGIGADIAVIPTSEALSAGDFVNIYDNAGTVNVRKADATNGIAFKADGFVKDAVTAGSNATVYFEGSNDQLAGLTPGSRYLLAATGGVTTTVPTTAGEIIQWTGRATSATSLAFEQTNPIVLG